MHEFAAKMMINRKEMIGENVWQCPTELHNFFLIARGVDKLRSKGFFPKVSLWSEDNP
ncbi:hypothetical protein J2Z65_006337 [Paenibacillus aceris]|uniref:Uncharacterized protein n=1 Tax=Paenibacillus aceris TaxID=869555 RepID=A0ABS4I8A3_9BACL|nr:hypothetical protein [Paenibacillus aceris]